MDRLTKYSNDIIRNRAVSILRKLSSENGLNDDEMSVISAFCLIERTENRKLKGYEDLADQGRLLELPCVEGDVVYQIEKFCYGGCGDCDKQPCSECRDYMPYINEVRFSLDTLNEFGKTIFLTRKEAETALQNLNGEPS